MLSREAGMFNWLWKPGPLPWMYGGMEDYRVQILCLRDAIMQGRSYGKKTSHPVLLDLTGHLTTDSLVVGRTRI